MIPTAATTLSLASVLAESAFRHPDALAVTDGVERITYRELWHQTRTFATVLRDRGIDPGDRVALMLPNTSDFPRVYFAILALGAVVVPIHPLLVAEEVRYVLALSGARLLVCEPETMPAIAPEADGTLVLTTAEIAAAASKASPIPGLVSTSPLDPAVMLFTSGTSGRPKAAVVSHLSMVEQTNVALLDSIDVRIGDVMCAALPLTHVFAQSNILNTAFRRGASVLLVRRFEATETLRFMAEHKATILAAVPTMLIALLNAATPEVRMPPLRYVISGGASLPVAVLEAFCERFDAPVLEGYGLSETAPTATVNHFGQEAIPGSIGTPIWGVDVQIAVPDISDRVVLVPDGEIGEIVIRGHGVFLGYHDNENATAEAVVDGWFRTGDLGKRDATGHVWIIDRTKDLIIRGGYNIYPREVEEVLVRMPGIRSVAVFGMPDEKLGQEVAAAVVVKPDYSRITDLDVIAFARAHIAAHKYPRVIKIVDALPLGSTGKVLKRELVHRFSPQTGETH